MFERDAREFSIVFSFSLIRQMNITCIAHSKNSKESTLNSNSNTIGTGERMSIKATRACIDAILDGSIANSTFVEDPVFGFEVPETLAGVPDKVLQPRQSWSDTNAYDEAAAKLATMFKDNYVKYTGDGVTDYTSFGPK